MRRGQWSVAMLSAVAMLVPAACSDDESVSPSEFVGRVDTICRSLTADLAALAPPAAPEQVGGFASGAADAYEEALVELRALSLPTGGDTQVAAAKELLAHFSAQIELLSQIATSAGTDEASAATQIAAFEANATASAGVVSTLGAPSCQQAPLFASVPLPTTTEPVVTDPPVTDPPVTDPVVTDPVVTEPVVTDPPIDAASKEIVPLAVDLPPTDGFTFVDAPEELTSAYVLFLDVANATSAATGEVTGVEVFDGGAAPVARIFVFVPDEDLPAAALTEVAALLAGDKPLTTLNIFLLPGLSYTADDGAVFFVAANDRDNVGLIMWAVGSSVEALDLTVKAYLTALQG